MILIAGLIALPACDEKLSDLTGPTPNLQPTFSSIQREVFETRDARGRSACVTCHVPGGLAASSRMFLTSTVAYDNLVNARSVGRPETIRVIPGDPDNSYLMHKLEGRPGIFGNRMPDDGPPYLTDGQILIIRRWIQLGARRD